MLLIWFVRLVHYLVVAFFLLAPFSDDQRILTMHLIGVPFLMLHWITNQSTCALTEIEKYLSGKEFDEETFIGSIVAPVYKFQSRDNLDIVLWVTLIFLWIFTLQKVRKDNYSHLRGVVNEFLRVLKR